MAIAAGIIFVWPLTHAGIPDGWERETSLDAKYPKGTALATDPNDTGGAATHTHTSTAHNHTMANHVHTIAITAATGSGSTTAGSSGTSTRKGHTHATFNSGNPSSVTVGTTAVTYAAMANDPPYHEVIFIKPSNPVAGLADDGICFVDTSSTLGFTFCNGSNDTPDLRNKYLKGAAALGDAGGTGGSLTNIHTINHAHTVSHVHSAATSGGSTTNVTNHDVGGGPNHTHTHSVTLPASTTATGTTSVSLTTAETVEPAYEKLIPVQNKTGNTLESVGMIGMWLGTLANIPSGWSEVPRLRGKHLKCANTTSEAGTTGGANTHTHAAQNHAHTGISHTHTYSTNLTHLNTQNTEGSGATREDAAAIHAGATINTTTYSLNNGSTSGASSSNEPAYRTVVFIKLTNIISGGAFLFNLI